MDCRAIEGPLNTQVLDHLGLYRSVIILCNSVNLDELVFSSGRDEIIIECHQHNSGN